MENYVVLRTLGSGSFGDVYLAKHALSGSLVALKKVPIHKPADGLPAVILREIQALQKLSAEKHSARSRHILPLREYFAYGTSIVLVMDFMNVDLHQIQGSLATVAVPFDPRAVKLLMYQWLRGVQGMHAQSVLHRDLKPSNLMFSYFGRLHIGDFGQARIYQKKKTKEQTTVKDHVSGREGGSYSHQVCTRWYRSPELLFGSRHYDSAVDIWSIGAAFYELLNGGAILFPGESDIDQLYTVLHIMGTPNDENWPGYKQLPDWGKIEFPPMAGVKLSTLCLESVPADAIQLLERLLTLNPAARISAEEALALPYFDDTRSHRDDLKHLFESGQPRPAATISTLLASTSSAAPHPPAPSTANRLSSDWHQYEEESLSDVIRFHHATKRWQHQQHEAAEAKKAKHAHRLAQSNLATCAATSSSSSSSSHHHYSSLHLSALEWDPLSVQALDRRLHQLPDAQLTIERLRQPFSLDDICQA